MRIINVNIAEYASIKNREIDFTDGLNIIEGENESGKSTILSFIKFILYGFPKRAAGEVLSEKERALSWSGGNAEGSMTVATDLGDFRIERSAKAKGDGGAKIIDLSTGTQVAKGEVPGELFLGVSLRVFESTACVKQLECSSIDGGELGGALENMFLSADETMNTQKAIGKIDRLRKKLLIKSGKGGSIYELSEKCASLEEKLRAAKEKNDKIKEYESGFARNSKLSTELHAELDAKTRLQKALDARLKLNRLEMYKSTKAKTESVKKDIDALKAEKCHLGFIPDGSYLRELSAAEHDYISAVQSEEHASGTLKNAFPPITGAELQKTQNAGRIRELGGEKAARDAYLQRRKKVRVLRAVGTVSLVLCACAMLLCALALLPINLPDFLRLTSEYLYAGAALSIFLAVISVFSFIASSREAKGAGALRRSLGYPEDAPDDGLYPFLLECVAADVRKKDAEKAKKLASDELETAEKRRAECYAKLCALLLKVGVSLPESTKADEVSEKVAKVIADAEETTRELAELECDLAKYGGALEHSKAEFAELDEKVLLGAVAPYSAEDLAVTPTALGREIDLIKNRLDTVDNGKYRLDRELITLRAVAEDPFKIEAELETLRKRLALEKSVHSALTLAEKSIEIGSENVHRNITPRLRAKASEIMASLTAGRYDDIGISQDFSITVRADGMTRPIEALSSGTKDASYLSVRLALADVLYGGKNPPVLLDEVLSQIDDRRAKAVLEMLRKYCDGGRQCLLFSCHTREEKMIDANIIKI